MLIKFLGKILFPKQPEWQRKRQIKTMLYVILAALIFASIVGGIMLYSGYKE